MTPFVLATANPDKAAEISRILGDRVAIIPRPPDIREVAETADTLHGNALLKAHALAHATGMPAIADDTGLLVEALAGAPGVYSSRYAGEHASYIDNVTKLLAELESVPEPRRARFCTAAVVAWPDGSQVAAEGAVEGQIIREPRGHDGFGYDPVFAPLEGDGRTFAEMRPDEKNRISHRARALLHLVESLEAGGVVLGSSEEPS